MLTTEQNETITGVGSGTLMGNLMRRYWHPVAATVQLEANPVRAVTLLGEALVLYRDKSGQLGLLAEACAHRGTSLAYGMPESNGLRCAYHSWLYDAGGQCIEQPAEPDGSSFKDHVRTTAYPVQELGGLIFAYLGPDPVPLLPRYNVLEWDDASREIDGTVSPCNWLQIMENLLDPYHVECLHGRYFEYVLRRKGGSQVEEFLAHYAPRHMRKIGFDLFDRGIIERHMYESEEEATWRLGIPTFFPTTTLMGRSGTQGALNFVVPLDDTHTWFIVYGARREPMRASRPDTVPFFDVSGADSAGNFLLDTANGQDHMAVVTQKPVAPRQSEHLATSDCGIILYRHLLMDQMDRVQRGEDPINVHRDIASSEMIEPPLTGGINTVTNDSDQELAGQKLPRSERRRQQLGRS